MGTDSIELWQLSLEPSTFEQVAQFEPVAAALATAEPGGPLSAELGASLVLVGDRLLSTVDIDGDVYWLTMDLHQRRAELAGRGSYFGVATDGQTLVAHCHGRQPESTTFLAAPSEVCAFRDIAALVAEQPLVSASLPSMRVSRFAFDRGVLYGAWHSTAAVEGVSLTDDLSQTTTVLERFDGWVDGFAVVDARVFVLNTWGAEAFIATFDVRDGRALRKHGLGGASAGRAFAGLWCGAASPPPLD